MDVEMRASDEDRHRVVAALQRHTEAGRLTLDEFAERVGEVYAARTLGDLATLTRDLPAEPSVAAPARTPEVTPQLVIALVAALAVLILLGLFMTLR